MNTLNYYNKLPRKVTFAPRIDGEICDLSDPPKLELQKKHTIEVVVDRFKVRSDLATRLAESFETTLELPRHGGCRVYGRSEGGSTGILCQLCLSALWLFRAGTGTSSLLL